MYKSQFLPVFYIVKLDVTP